MKAQQLKNAILQLAIQGKLVPQDPNDEPASELLCKIQAEKDRLIAEGKIKKSKKSTDKAPYTIEPPFEIPETWVWVRLVQLGDVIGGGTPKTTDNENWDNGTISWLTPADMKFVAGKYVSKGERNITEKGLNSSSARMLSKNSIVYSSRAPIGYIAITENELSTNQGFKSIDFYIKDIVDYIYYALISLTAEIQSRASGTTFKEISGSEFGQTIIPLPPLPEQHRIVQKIEELLPLVERYDQTEQKLTKLNDTFPEQLKKSVLQAAIQGKLTEQLATDEPASELLKRIETEKMRLISEGKLKKPRLRDNSQNTKFEPPFEIPQGWEWVRLGDIGEWGSGATPSRHEPKFYENGTIPWLKTGDLNDGIITEIPEYITPLAVEKSSVKLNPIGSVLIAMYGATIGKLGILNIEATTNQACCACIPYNGIYNKFLFYYLMSQKTEFQKCSEGSGQPNISKEKIISSLFPLPPIQEQKRIVEKVELLLSQIERL